MENINRGESMSKASLIKKGDKLFGSWFHDHHRHCAIEDCNNPCELHHIIGRGNHLFRWSRLNAIGLCEWHHKYSKLLSAHASPESFFDWLSDNRPEEYYFWEHNRHTIGVSLTEDWYRQKIEELKLL
jgi:hypothetical protein